MSSEIMGNREETLLTFQFDFKNKLLGDSSTQDSGSIYGYIIYEKGTVHLTFNLIRQGDMTKVVNNTSIMLLQYVKSASNASAKKQCRFNICIRLVYKNEISLRISLSLSVYISLFLTHTHTIEK